MEKIDWNFITQEAGDQKNIIVPMAIDYNCPYCNRTVHFKMGWTGTSYQTYACKAHCSGCGNYPHFVYIVLQPEINAPRRGDLFIYPKSNRRKPFEGIGDIQNLSPELKEEYDSLIRIFNMQEWIPASVMCRRILEGLMKNLLPDQEHTKVLFQQILVIDQYKDLKKPIKDIADVLRIAGNKGAHFDPVNKPNKITLELMIDLIDYLLEYFFVLPDKTESLRNQVINISS